MRSTRSTYPPTAGQSLERRRGTDVDDEEAGRYTWKCLSVVNFRGKTTYPKNPGRDI